MNAQERAQESDAVDRLDSDDETPRFAENDDLYSSDADDADAKWVSKQVKFRPMMLSHSSSDMI